VDLQPTSVSSLASELAIPGSQKPLLSHSKLVEPWSSAVSWAAEMALCLSSIERSSKGTCAFSYSIFYQP